MCSHCHGEVADGVNAPVCPACGGALVERAGGDLAEPAVGVGIGPRVVDHRGIVLPGRHAVGGVITPR